MKRSSFKAEFDFISISVGIILGMLVGLLLMNYASSQIGPIVLAERGYDAIGGEYLFYGIIFSISILSTCITCRLIFNLIYRIYFA